MSRWIGLLNLAQAGLYVVMALQMGPRWAVGAAALWLAAVAQIAGGAALLAERGTRPARWASILSLVAGALVVGAYLQVSTFIATHYGPEGGAQGWQVFGATLLAAPWALFFPLWQLLATRPDRTEATATGSGVLLALLVPPLGGLSMDGAPSRYAPVDGQAVASWVWGQSLGAPAHSAPDRPGAALIGVTHLRDGVVLGSQTLSGPSLGEALRSLDLSVRGTDALVVEIVTATGRLVQPSLAAPAYYLRPGEQGLVAGAEVLGSVALWRSDAAWRRALAPGVFVPAAPRGLWKDHQPTGWADTEPLLVSAEGVVALDRTWAAAPELTTESLHDAVRAAALHIAHNQAPDGRYAYEVQGPSGDYGRGYNFPRHAGATWFLARAWSRTGDPEVRRAADLGVAWLARHTQTLEDGRSFVLDPGRRDGKVWVGTTSLALLALLVLDSEPALRDGYARFIGSSVDARGMVRGDMEVTTGLWPEQPQVSYAEGQAILALAAASRAGLTEVDEPLDRAIAYLDGPYLPRPGRHLFTLDEHWTCLAALAVQEVRGEPVGEDICTAYLQQATLDLPPEGSPLTPATGPAGGLAEAVVAKAELERRRGVKGHWHDLALRYGRLFLAHQYQEADRPMLGRAERLVGGFRDHPWKLDVRVDAVQHVGCALLGVEQLYGAKAVSGGMP